MKKIAIVCDSSISFTKEELEKYKVYVVPNIIMHNNQEYLDLIDITTDEVNSLLEKKETITTSQPNIGAIVELFKEITAKNYEYIFILPISSNLSGGYNAFYQAAQIAKLENYSIIDSYSIAGPVQQAVKAIYKMNNEDYSIEEITEYLEFIFANQVSYLFPESLDQIAASGRLSKTAVTIASLLKIKAVVYFQKGSKSIEKLGVARTDKKIFDIIIKDIEKDKVSPKTHDIYFLESRAKDKVEKFREQLFEQIGSFNYYVVNLPASLSVHTGVGAIAVQYCPKLK